MPSFQNISIQTKHLITTKINYLRIRTENLHAQMIHSSLNPQLDYYMHPYWPHSSCGLHICVLSQYQSRPPQISRIFNLLCPLGVWSRHPLLLILSPRTICTYSPPISPHIGVIHICLFPNTHLPVWTHRLLICMLVISIKERDGRGHILRNV